MTALPPGKEAPRGGPRPASPGASWATLAARELWNAQLRPPAPPTGFRDLPELPFPRVGVNYRRIKETHAHHERR
jgi:hypothetical protein